MGNELALGYFYTQASCLFRTASRPHQPPPRFNVPSRSPVAVLHLTLQFLKSLHITFAFNLLAGIYQNANLTVVVKSQLCGTLQRPLL